jgi:hypothetical protein
VTNSFRYPKKPPERRLQPGLAAPQKVDSVKGLILAAKNLLQTDMTMRRTTLFAISKSFSLRRFFVGASTGGFCGCNFRPNYSCNADSIDGPAGLVTLGAAGLHLLQFRPALAHPWSRSRHMLSRNPDVGMTLLPLHLLVIPEYFCSQLLDIDETPASGQKCPHFAANFRCTSLSGRWGC